MKQNNQAIPFNKENFKQIFSVSFVLVILISIPGAIIADFFNIPLAWFLGPMLVTSLASLMGLKIEMPRNQQLQEARDRNTYTQIHHLKR